MITFCSLYSGSSGNSILVGSNNTKILVDAGVSGKSIICALEDINELPQNIKGIFITHEHIDHIKGAGIFSRKFDTPIYANAETWCAMESQLGKIKEHNIKVIDKREVYVGDLIVKGYNISHDATNPMGYNIYCEDKKITIATDLGYVSEEVKLAIKDSDILLMESNHDVEMLKFGSYPYSLKQRVLSNIGHLSNDSCGEALVEYLKKNSKSKKVFLGHLSRNNNFPELAYKTVEGILTDNGVSIGEDVDLKMTYRDKVSKLIEL